MTAKSLPAPCILVNEIFIWRLAEHRRKFGRCPARRAADEWEPRARFSPPPRRPAATGRDSTTRTPPGDARAADKKWGWRCLRGQALRESRRAARCEG